jgi:pimeloyl-ACP methyl ester carboxylesterase
MIASLFKPQGPHPTGVALWEGGAVVLAERRCCLTARLWYPAKSSPARWQGLAQLGRRVSADNVAQPPSQGWPVVLLLPGWSGGIDDNTMLAASLASYGFLIVAVGYYTRAQPGAGPESAMDFSSSDAYARTVARANVRLDAVAGALTALLDRLCSLRGDDAAGLVLATANTDRIGVVGHSFGGAIGIELCTRDQRVTAAINIDGWLFDAAPGWIGQNFMFIGDGSGLPDAEDLRSADPWRRYPAMLAHATDQRKAEALACHGGIDVTLRKTRHQDFADFPYLSRMALLRGRRPSGRAIHLAAALTTAFLSQSWTGRPSLLLSSPPEGASVHVFAPDAHRTMAAR